MMPKHTCEFRDEGDEVIAEVRTVRHQISARFGHDALKLVAYYIELQRFDPGRFIPAPNREKSAG